MTLDLPLEAERVVLRRLQPGDGPRFAAYRADAELARYQGWNPMTPAEALAFIAAADEAPTLGTGTWHQLAIAERGSGLLLGDIGLCGRENGEVELGFTLMHEAQGRGLATEALGALVQALWRHPQVRCIVAETDERNHASIRVLERLGLTLVERREAVFKNEPCIELRYRLLRPGSNR